LNDSSPTSDIINRGQPELLPAAGVPQPLHDASGRAVRGAAGRDRPDQHQRDHHGGVRDGVHGEARRRPDRDDQDTGDRRADHPGAVHHHAVQADRAGQIGGLHQRADERLPGRRVDDLHEPAN
jgi:hypothetical protein